MHVLKIQNSALNLYNELTTDFIIDHNNEYKLGDIREYQNINWTVVEEFNNVL